MSLVKINRRFFLRGAGVMMALPYFESLAWAAGNEKIKASPKFCFFYLPNGVAPTIEAGGVARPAGSWRPTQLGNLDPNALPSSMEAFKSHLEYLTIVSGLHLQISAPVAGVKDTPHQSHAGSFLTGAHAHMKKNGDPKLYAGQSIDHLLGETIGKNRKKRLLSLSTEISVNDTGGLSPIFNYSLSWQKRRNAAGQIEVVPVTPIISSRAAFDALFGSGVSSEGSAKDREEELLGRRSVLDAVTTGITELRQHMSMGEFSDMDDHFQLVREYELGLQNREIEMLEICKDEQNTYPEDISENRDKTWEQNLTDKLTIIHLGLKCGITQVATLALGAEFSDVDYSFLKKTDYWVQNAAKLADINMSGEHHHHSHHGNSELNSIKVVTEIDAFHSRKVAELVEMMKNTPDVDGTNLLDNTVILYGAGMTNGDHSVNDIPIALFGKGAGLLDPGKTGTHIGCGGVPLANLFQTMLKKNRAIDETGGPIESFGNSDGDVDLPGGQKKESES